MSDSPLDGGSGWPTSAYAIIPRSADRSAVSTVGSGDAGDAEPAGDAGHAGRANPAGGPSARTDRDGPVTAPTEALVPVEAAAASSPPVAPPREVPTKDNATRGPRGAVLGLAAAGVAVVVALAVVAFALRPSGTGADATERAGDAGRPGAPLEPTGDDAGNGARQQDRTAGPSTGAQPGAAPGATMSGQPATPGASGTDPGRVPESGSDVLRSGTIRLAAVAGQPDETFDLDSGERVGAGSPPERQPDIGAAVLGLNALNGARFAAWTGPPPATSAGCAAVPEAQWSTSIVLGALIPGATVCARSNEGRFAAFTVRSGQALTAGQLYATELDFVVWRKPGD